MTNKLRFTRKNGVYLIEYEEDKRLGTWKSISISSELYHLLQALETELKELDSFKTVCLETCPKRMSEIRKQKNLKTDNERLKEFAQHLETWWND